MTEVVEQTEDPSTYQHSEYVDDPDGYGRTGEPGERAEIGKPFVKPVRLLILLGLFGGLAVWRGLPIMVVVLAILVMIFFHELGHYVMARRAGMKVTEFMIGFGPRIFSFRRGDVEYGIKAIPAGAYVKIIGMANIEDVPPEDEAQTYRQKGYWARMGVAVAGSTMHFIMAMILVVLSFVFVGRVTPERWAVSEVSPGSAAAGAGIREGDTVKAIGDSKITTFDEMSKAAIERPGETVPVIVERDGKDLELTASISARFDVFGTIGEGFQVYENSDGGMTIAAGRSGNLYDDGLRDGDVLRTVGGTQVTSIDQLRTLLSATAITSSGDVVLGVVHEGKETVQDVSLDVGSELGLGNTRGFLGVGPQSVPEKLNVLEAVPAGFAWFGDTTWQSVVGMTKFFNPSNLADFVSRVVTTAPGSTRDLGLPEKGQSVSQQNQQAESKRIVSIAGAVLLGEDLTEGGWGSLLQFLALLNLAIGILNLIPLPPFDGGHVAIGTYEKIRELLRRDGRRYFADYNKLVPLAIVVIGFMATVGLMATYLDLADPIRL